MGGAERLKRKVLWTFRLIAGGDTESSEKTFRVRPWLIFRHCSPVEMNSSGGQKSDKGDSKAETDFKNLVLLSVVISLT